MAANAISAIAFNLGVSEAVVRAALARAAIGAGSYHVSKALERLLYDKSKSESKEETHGGVRRAKHGVSRGELYRLALSESAPVADDAEISALKKSIEDEKAVEQQLYEDKKMLGFSSLNQTARREKIAAAAQAHVRIQDLQTKLREKSEAQSKAQSVAAARAAETKSLRRYARNYRRWGKAVKAAKSAGYLSKYKRFKKRSY